MKHKYDVTVIIPVYNREKLLSRSIDSIIKQNYDFNKIEVILINDGSTDGSKDVCLKFVDEYKNIKYFEQKNKGVSAARNVGLKNATGKYITFLDSDDILLKNTIKSLVDFFNQHNSEIDLITYPIFYEENKNIKPHIRYANIKENYGTGIYDLKNNTNFIQTNMNIIIKNQSNKIEFEEQLLLHEDQVFILEHLKSKQKIGFIDKGGYVYKRDVGDSLSFNLKNPYYSFESAMKIYNYWLEDNSFIKVKKYVENMILYNLSWKLKSDFFYPYYEINPEYEKYSSLFKKIIQNINVESIQNNLYLNEYQKSYILSLKLEKLKFIGNGKSYKLTEKNKIIYDINLVDLVFTNIKILNNNQILFEGFLKDPSFNFISPSLKIKVNNELKEIKLFNSTKSRIQGKLKTNNFLAFSFNMNIKNLNDLEFCLYVNKVIVNVKFVFNNRIPDYVNKTNVLFLKKYNLIFTNKNKIIFKKNFKLLNLFKKMKVCFFYFKLNPKFVLVRLFAKLNKSSSKIWLYNDRKDIIDNAFYQFRYDLYKKDNIKRFYIYDDEKTKQLFSKEEQQHLVKFKSIKHMVLFLKAKLILTSFGENATISPFGHNIKNYYDLVNFEIIYLQHGVLHANLPWLYSKEINFVDKVVISSKFEQNNFIENYSYSKHDLIPTGMPRLDLLNIKQSEPTKILIALSWRSNLIGELDPATRKRKLKLDSFKKSVYYKEINGFLNNKEVFQVLEKFNIKIDFMSHPIFRDYDKEFHFDTKLVSFVNSANPDDYKLIVTDYSSIVFDYVYKKIPVIYFVPDYHLFKAGVSHNYNKLDLPLEKAFGPLTIDSNEFVKELKLLIKRNFKMEKKYQDRYDEFFITKSNHREKLYKYLIKEGDDKL